MDKAPLRWTHLIQEWGAVLSQRLPVDGVLHPCAFYSHRLTPAEVNYDVGNRELLAIVTALQEWRHWLEGTSELFVVYTDHRNLEYLRAVKTQESSASQVGVDVHPIQLHHFLQTWNQEQETGCTLPHPRPRPSSHWSRAHPSRH
ncbi:uncharacterized protein LOC144024231 [Festucalex cinctus]